MSDVLRATSKPAHGWHFPSYGVQVPAAEIIVRNRGPACTTTFTVS